MRRNKMSRIRRGLVALGAAALATIGVAAPASADSEGPWCFKWRGQVICVPVHLDWNWELGCPQCGLAVDWLPDPQEVVGRQIALGLGDLSTAGRTLDPVRRAQLRAAAFDKFTQAAQASPGARPFPARAGFIDELGTVKPQPEPWLQAAAQDISVGVGYIQLALNDWTGGGAGFRQQAVAKLDEAYAELAHAQVIGT
ncbi:hypothetical protein [Amycolatopsis sp. NPDC004772]